MVNFLRRFFREEPEETNALKVAPQERMADPEVLVAREKNFRSALDEYLDRTATNEEFALAKSELLGDDPYRAIEPMLKEEMIAKIRGIGEKLGWAPELFPEMDLYEAMGNRQAGFERTLAKSLGRSLTWDDIEDARAMFEGDAEIRGAWKTMIGEEVSRYAEKVASRIARNRLRVSRPSQEEYLGEQAAK